MPEETSILPLGIYSKLGHRTFWLFLSERSAVAVTFFVLAILFTLARRMGALPQEAHIFLGLAGVVCFVIFFISIAVSAGIAWVTYRSHQFCLTDDALKIRSGTITEKEIAIPYRQIQNVMIERTVSEQILGLSRIIVSTSAHDNENTPEDESRGTLPAIDKRLAIALQEELLRRADIQRVYQTRR